jgi:hypothetical protein
MRQELIMHDLNALVVIRCAMSDDQLFIYDRYAAYGVCENDANVAALGHAELGTFSPAEQLAQLLPTRGLHRAWIVK